MTSLRTIGLGFPDDVPIPTTVGTCGDGIHVAFVSANKTADCECDRMTVEDMGPLVRDMARVVFPDVVLDGTSVGDIRRLHARIARP